MNTNNSVNNWPTQSGPYRLLFASDPQYYWAEEDISAPSMVSDGAVLYMIYQCVQSGKIFTGYSTDAQNWLVPKNSSQLSFSRPVITYDSASKCIFVVYQSRTNSAFLTLAKCSTDDFKAGNLGDDLVLNVLSLSIPAIAMLADKVIILYTQSDGLNCMSVDWNTKTITKSLIANTSGYSTANISLIQLNSLGTQTLAAVVVVNHDMIYMSSSDGVNWTNWGKFGTTIFKVAAIVSTSLANGIETPTVVYTSASVTGPIALFKTTRDTNNNWSTPVCLFKETTDYPAAAFLTIASSTVLCIVYKSINGYNFLYSAIPSDASTPSYRTQINKPNNTTGPDAIPSKSETQIESVFKSMIAIKSDAKEGDVKAVMINGDLTASRTTKQRHKMQDLLKKLTDAGIQVVYGLGNHDYVNDRHAWDEDCVNMVSMLYSDMSELSSGGVDITRSNKAGQIHFDGSGMVWAMYANVVLLQFNYYPSYTAEFKGSGKTINYVDLTDAMPYLEFMLTMFAAAGYAAIICMHYYGKDWDTQTFDDLIKKYNVTAVFAGHIHQDIGFQKYIGDNNTLPLFRCGASTYQNYLAAAFDFVTSQMTVSVIMNELDGTSRALPSPTVCNISPLTLPPDAIKITSPATETIRKKINHIIAGEHV